MKEDLTNNSFGQWFVENMFGKDKHNKILWNCICSCGEKSKVTTSDLKSGKSSRCKNCYIASRVKKEGYLYWKHPLYSTYCGMKQRCNDVNCKAYKNYGGRGITICDRWLESFENFVEDMGEKPENTSLDRIDNDREYSKDNCRWVDKGTQSLNKRRKIYFNGKYYRSIAELADLHNINQQTLYWRLYNNWSLEKALNDDVRRI